MLGNAVIGSINFDNVKKLIDCIGICSERRFSKLLEPFEIEHIFGEG